MDCFHTLYFYSEVKKPDFSKKSGFCPHQQNLCLGNRCEQSQNILHTRCSLTQYHTYNGHQVLT
jgi:hypothetical protein